VAPKWENISVPYGSLLPIELGGAIGAGRHVACDASSHTFLREIPQCWMTGQAAGVAGALAAAAGVSPRKLDVRSIQRELLKQGAYLSPAVAAAAEMIAAAAE
jgi:FAD dependent oxidoreductase